MLIQCIHCQYSAVSSRSSRNSLASRIASFRILQEDLFSRTMHFAHCPLPRYIVHHRVEQTIQRVYLCSFHAIQKTVVESWDNTVGSCFMVKALKHRHLDPMIKERVLEVQSTKSTTTNQNLPSFPEYQEYRLIPVAFLHCSHPWPQLSHQSHHFQEFRCLLSSPQ